jgi:hypothetical protein
MTCEGSEKKWRAPNAPYLKFLSFVTGDEVDLVVETGERLFPIEIKATARPGTGDAISLQKFKSEYGRRCPGGLLLHAGERTEWLTSGVLAVPWWRVI